MYKNRVLLKIMSIFVSTIMLLILLIQVMSNAASKDTAKKVTLKTIEDIKKYKTELNNNYPGYYDKLLTLKQNNSNWTFTLYYTGINWNTVIYNETEGYHGRSLVQGKVGNWICSKCKEKVYDGSDWLCASKEAVAYLMDVRNYLKENTIFQFEKLSYDPDLYSIQGINKVLNGTFMYEKNIREYYNNSNYENITFAQKIMDAATKSGVSPYYLAARIRQEVGVSGSGSTSGTYKGYEGYFNFYNIGANAGANPISNGLNFAKNKAASYLGPWNTPGKAIEGGAIWIAKNYIAAGQDTLYFQKFDVVSNGTAFYNHQYMQNIFAAKNEGITTYNTYKSMGILDNNYNFVIPLYVGMPNSLSVEPKVTKVTGLNEKVQVKSTVNLRKSPTTTSTVITKLQQNDIITRTERYVTYANGYYWDKVKILNGTVGYVATNYITTNIKTVAKASEKITISTAKKTLGVKEKYKIKFSVTPKNTKVTFISSNKKVAIVDKNGKVTAKKKGIAWVTVKTSNGKTAKIKITVKKAPTKITLNAKSKTLKKNKTFKLKARLSTGSAGKITYSSSNKKIATVNGSGKITAKKKGKANITAKTYNGKKAKIRIRVK